MRFVTAGVLALALSGCVDRGYPGGHACKAAGTTGNAVAPSDKPTYTITLRGHDGWCYELAEQGGPKVLTLAGGPAGPPPAEMRFKPVEGRTLVEATAAAHGLKVTWTGGGRFAILYVGASDREVERVRADLASTDPVVRRDAAWWAGWLPDVRIVPLLMKAARDPDAGVAKRAVEGLRRMGWEAVLRLDESGWDLLEAECKSPDGYGRSEAVAALGQLGGPRAVRLLGELFEGSSHFLSVPLALGLAGGEQALGILTEALADTSENRRSDAATALGRLGAALPPGQRAKALAALVKALGDRHMYVRRSAAYAMEGLVRGLPADQAAEALASLKEAMSDEEADVRRAAAFALGSVGGPTALALIENAFSSQDASLRSGAASALGRVGGQKALLLLEAAMEDREAEVRRSAAYALSRVGGPQAMVLLAKAITDPDDSVRWGAADALAFADALEGLELLARAMASPCADVRAGAASALGRVGGPRMLAMVRPENCIELAGESPVAANAGEPRSRPRAMEKTLPPERGVESPQGVIRLLGGRQVRRPSIMRTLQPREMKSRKVGLAEPLMSRRRQQTASGTGAMQDARGVWRRACGHSLVRNRRDPSWRPASGVGGPYKPTAKGDRAGRESEGPIVPWTPVEKAGRGKGPCFGRGGVGR